MAGELPLVGERRRTGGAGMKVTDYSFLPADAKTSPLLSDIREQIETTRQALDAIDELAAKLASRSFEMFYDACPTKGASCPYTDRWCVDCWIEKMNGTEV